MQSHPEGSGRALAVFAKEEEVALKAFERGACVNEDRLPGDNLGRCEPEDRVGNIVGLRQATQRHGGPQGFHLAWQIVVGWDDEARCHRVNSDVRCQGARKRFRRAKKCEL